MRVISNLLNSDVKLMLSFIHLQVGIYAVNARNHPVTCVIHALFLFVSGALLMPTMYL